MNIDTTYAAYLVKLLEQLPLTRTEREQLAKLIAEGVQYPISEQDRPLAEILNTLANLDQDRELGFLMGGQVPLTSYGTLSMGLRLAPTYREALKLTAKYHALDVPLVSYEFQDDPEGGVFTVGFKYPVNAHAEAMMMAAVSTAVNKELSRITQQNINFLRLQLTDSSKGMEGLYQKHFSIRPEVGHEANRLYFDEWALELPNPLADEETFESIRRDYAERSVSAVSVNKMSDWVRDKLMASISDPPSLKALAESVHVSERQLRFSLSKENASYRNILKDCRLQVAASLFRNRGLHMSEIAYRLGYSELATFTNCFKRWTGQTPTEYRKQLLKNLAQSAGE